MKDFKNSKLKLTISLYAKVVDSWLDLMLSFTTSVKTAKLFQTSSLDSPALGTSELSLKPPGRRRQQHCLQQQHWAGGEDTGQLEWAVCIDQYIRLVVWL